MTDAQELIPCEHCTVIIIDQENTEVRTVTWTTFNIEYLSTFNIEYLRVEHRVFCLHQEVVFMQAFEMQGFSDEVV